MPISPRRRKPNRLRILLMPIIALAFGIGWILYNMGSPKSKKSQKTAIKTQPKDDGVQLMAIPQEEQTIKN
jgi:hypothetical protein